MAAPPAAPRRRTAGAPEGGTHGSSPRSGDRVGCPRPRSHLLWPDCPLVLWRWANGRSGLFQLNKDDMSRRLADVLTVVLCAGNQPADPDRNSTSRMMSPATRRRRNVLRVYMTLSGCSCGRVELVTIEHVADLIRVPVTQLRYWRVPDAGPRVHHGGAAALLAPGRPGQARRDAGVHRARCRLSSPQRAHSVALGRRSC